MIDEAIVVVFFRFLTVRDRILLGGRAQYFLRMVLHRLRFAFERIESFRQAFFRADSWITRRRMPILKDNQKKRVDKTRGKTFLSSLLFFAES